MRSWHRGKPAARPWKPRSRRSKALDSIVPGTRISRRRRSDNPRWKARRVCTSLCSSRARGGLPPVKERI